MQSCCERCHALAGCSFFDFQPRTGTCRLMASRVTQHPASPQHTAGRVGGGEWGWADGAPLRPADFSAFPIEPARKYNGKPIVGAACALLVVAREGLQRGKWVWAEAPCSLQRAPICRVAASRAPAPPRPPPPLLLPR